MVMNGPVAGDIPMYAVAVSGNGLSPLLHPERLSPQADFIPRYYSTTNVSLSVI